MTARSFAASSLAQAATIGNTDCSIAVYVQALNISEQAFQYLFSAAAAMDPAPTCLEYRRCSATRLSFTVFQQDMIDCHRLRINGERNIATE
jgi:hypothetical protein